jgi:carboxypeptidase Q
VKLRMFLPFVSILLIPLCTFSQERRPAVDSQAPDEPDSSAIAQIIEEGTARSHVMDLLSYVSDVYGPRLTGSPAYKRAAEWARNRLDSMGLSNAHLESWGPFGRGWELKHYDANVIGKQVFPLLSYPKAWSPGIDATGDVILVEATSDSALETYRGKLGKKFVLLGGPRSLTISFEPLVTRETDSHLLELANSDLPKVRRPRRPDFAARRRERARVETSVMEMCEKEGALAILTAGAFDGGSIMVMSATVPNSPDTPYTRRIRPWDSHAPKILPQIAVGVEHYNRMARMLEKGEKLRIEMNLDVQFTKVDSGYNVIAELPGTDLKDQIVMIGAHLDSWHGATGATDNGTGVAVCMEAMRILKTLGLRPRRTIRIGLWDGEEQGEYGSKAYVARHLGERLRNGEEQKIEYKPDAERFSVYFNDDNGTGKFRGLYMQSNEAVRPIFRKWFAPFGKENSFTLTLSGTSNTDHEPFNDIGIPAFQFIQDDIEYFTRTWHSTMDLYDRSIEDDLKQSSVIMAGFAFNAAMRDEMIPRKSAEN